MNYCESFTTSTLNAIVILYKKYKMLIQMKFLILLDSLLIWSFELLLKLSNIIKQQLCRVHDSFMLHDFALDLFLLAFET